MRNIFKLALLSLILMIGCSKENELPTLTQESTTFYASIETSESRTYADQYGKLLWNADDRITLFKGSTYNRQYRYTGETGQNSGEFKDLTDASSVIAGNTLSANYAVYPYNEKTSFTNDGKISYTVPAVQQYVANSFGLGANTMVAATKDTDDNFLAFKNLGGYFEFSLYGNVTVKSIEFKGNNNEKLAGAASITVAYNSEPTIVYSNEATESITLDCGTGVALGTTEENATKFWFVAPAIEYTNGITITITDTEGRVMTKSTSNKITISRSTVQPLHAFKVDTRDANTPPNNQIWYTTTNANTMNPYTQNWDGDWVVDEAVSIVSNEYVDGKGIITFSGDVTQIVNSAFTNKTELKSITLPNSITSIGSHAFSNTSLSEIYIPKNVTTIGDSAFSCETLTQVEIASNNITSMGQGCFQAALNLTKFISSYASSDNRCLIIDNTLYAFAPYGITEYTIPDNVKALEGGVFAYCSDISKITLPNNLESIGDNSFAYCNFEEITIPESVSSIGKQAFYKTKGLAYIKCDIPSTSSMSSYNFQNPFFETELSIVFSGTSIGDRAFEYAKSTSIVLLDGLKSIGYCAFGGCKNIETLSLPNSLETIGRSAFLDCTKLKEIVIPNNVKVLQYYIFQGCSLLESVIVGSGVTSLYDRIFYNCVALKNVKFYSQEPPTIQDLSLFNIIKQEGSGTSAQRTFDIYVPQSSIDKYQSKWGITTLKGF